MQIQGGEPFVHPNIREIIEWAESSESIDKITLATNGTIIPEKCIQVLRNPKVEIRISDYGEVNSEKAKALSRYLDCVSVNYRYYNFVNQNSTWSLMGGGKIRRGLVLRME